MPKVKLCSSGGGAAAGPLAPPPPAAPAAGPLTAWVHQVKAAVPTVEERRFKRGQVLIREGAVPEGLFLITAGTCEIIYGGGDAAWQSAAGGCAMGASQSRAGTGAGAEDFTDRLSDSDECSSEDLEGEEADEGDGVGAGPGGGLAAAAAAAAARGGWRSRRSADGGLGYVEAEAVALDLDHSAAGGSPAGSQRGRGFGSFGGTAQSSADGGGGSGGRQAPQAQRRRSFVMFSQLIGRIAGTSPSSPPPSAAALVGGSGVLGIGSVHGGPGSDSGLPAWQGGGAGGAAGVRRRRAASVDMDWDELPRPQSAGVSGGLRPGWVGKGPDVLCSG
jgi:hypothetical protein